VGLIPLAERRSIDLDNGGLGEGVRADKLVVGRVVNHLNDTSLAGASLRGPGEVARVETESTVLVVTATGADGVDALGTDTGVRRLAARLEGSLLPCTQLSEISFISICVEQAQNAMGWVPMRVCPPVRGQTNSHRNLPSGPSSAPRDEGLVYSIRAAMGGDHDIR
jgi:hypothetical protein